MRLHPHAPACHLHIQAGAHGRAQHGDQVDVWVIEAGSQHVGIGEGLQPSGLEVGQHALALLLGRLACHALSSHPMLAHDCGDVLGVLHTCAKHQPRLALACQLDDLAHHALVVVLSVHSGLQLGLDELPATLVHASGVQLGLGDLGAQRGQILFENQLLDGHRLDQGIEQRRLVGDETMPQAIGRGGEADHPQARIDGLQLGQQLAVASLVLVVDQVALVDQHQIDVAQLLGLGAHRLDACKGDRLAELLLANAGAVDAKRCTRPMLAHLLGILLDQLLDVRQHEHHSLRPVLQGILA